MSSPCSRLTLILVGVMISASAVSGQAPASQQTSSAHPETTVFHANANLVLVDVVVTKRDETVHGLDRNRFHVFEDGHEQTIASFEEHCATTASAAAVAKPVALPPHTYTNVPAYPEAPAVNVLLLDGLNTLAADQMDVRHQMLQYIGTIKPGTSLAIFTLSSRLHQLSGFTTDPAALAKALMNKKAGPQSSSLLNPDDDKQENRLIAEMDSIVLNKEIIDYMRLFQADKKAYEIDRRVAMTLEALQDLARYLSAVPGRKNLVWFSSSFPVALDPDITLVNPFKPMRNYSQQIQETSDLLAAARVAVYPVDARGFLKQPYLEASNSFEDTMERGSTDGMRPTADAPNFSIANGRFTKEVMAERSAMQQIAAATGGKVFNNTNGFKEAVADAVENGSCYYTVGYTPAAKQFDGQFRKLQLRVDNGKFGLAYRRGYYADPPDKPSEHNLGKTSLMLSVTLHGAPPATQIQFQARVLPASDPLLLDANLPDTPMGELTATLKGPLHRYVVDLKADPRGFAYKETPDGDRHASAEFTLVAYNSEGQRVNFVDHGVQMSLNSERYTQTLSTGLLFRMAIDLPVGEYSLRIAVRDRVTEKIGSLEIPLTIAAK